MKSEYLKFVKYLEKQKAVYFQKDAGEIFLTDGVLSLSVPLMIYSKCIEPLSPIFCPAPKEDGTGMKIGNDPVIFWTDAAPEIATFVRGVGGNQDTVKSRFSLDLDGLEGNMRPVRTRIFFSNHEIIVIKEEFVEIFSRVLPGTPWKSTGIPDDPIFKQKDGIKVVVFPIRVPSDVFKVWSNEQQEGRHES